MSGPGSSDRVGPDSGSHEGISDGDELASGAEESALDPVAAAMVADGRALRLVTRGRRTGRPVTVAVGFVEEPDGSLLVAAGRPDADWARNLLAEPRCRVAVGDRAFEAEAEPLEGAEAGRAIRELILRYGTPAERLGSGPAFRLRPRIFGAPGRSTRPLS